MADSRLPFSLSDIRALDAHDPLSGSRAAFGMPDGEIYLVGHSLGPQSRTSRDALARAQVHWEEDIVGAWNTAGWIDMPMRVGAKIAPLLGVEAGDVAVCDSVSVNLFKLVGALVSGREAARIIVEAGEFPTDQYILERLADVAGCGFVRVEPGAGVEHMERGAVLVRSLVDYRTAHVADVGAMELRAKERGADIVWDLSHATGVVDLKLKAWGARYAVGCTYKYLCGGPGAPAFIYADGKAVGKLHTTIAGWLGHARPFAFEPTYTPAPGVERFVAGTPPILSMAALEGALDMFEGVNLSRLERKARRLGDMCLDAFACLDLPSSSPPIGSPRGGHVAFNHPEGYAVSRALAARGVWCDFRPPDTIRFGLSPLTLSFADVRQALLKLEDVLVGEAYRDPKFSRRDKVT